jgi:hypothetical protein
MFFRTTLLSALVLLGACAPTAFDGAADMGLSARSADEEAGLVEFLNDYQVSTFQVLDEDCAIRSDSAQNIDDFRAGPDGRYGNGNDGQFTDEQSVLDIHMVGPWTLEMLYECAADFGYVELSCTEAPHSEYVDVYDANWTDQVPADLLPVIDGYTGTTDLCGQDYPWAPARFVGVTTHYANCDIAGYTLEYRQLIDPECGVQIWLTIELDASYNELDLSCMI